MTVLRLGRPSARAWPAAGLPAAVHSRGHPCPCAQMLSCSRMAQREYLQRVGPVLWQVKCRMMYLAAWVWRRLLFRTTFIAITGSVGKTTAKECLAAALSSRFPTALSFANQNDYSGVPRSVLRVRPWHRFAVLELATSRFGLMKRSAQLVRPDVAVILKVARVHVKNFRTLENTAAEKAQLLAALRPQGVAVLNGDDPRVTAMAGRLRRRIVWFGSSPAFDYWTGSASSKWPARLSFDIHAGGEHGKVQTRLVGTHWRDAVLGAIAAAHVCGLALPDAIAAVSLVEPTCGRMQPATIPSGAIMIRDEFNGSTDTLNRALEAFADAVAGRKILVITDVTDDSRSPHDRLRRIGKDAGRIFDSVVFIGERAGHGVRGAVAGGVSPEHTHEFASWEPAAEFLKREIQPEDLVLLRGRTGDHLTRLYFALCGTVACRKVRCDKTIVCDLCPELGALIPLQPASTPIFHTAFQ